MREWTVTVDWRATEPLTEDHLFDVAELGGAATGRPGDHDISATMTVDAGDIPAAAAAAIERMGERVAGEPAGVEVLTTDEADRRLEAPAFPELVGISEISDMLGVSRQRASALQTNTGFPAPVAVLRSGPVWRKGDLSTFAEAWARKPGRPRKAG